MNYPKLELISGFSAKVLLQVFMDNRTQELIEETTNIDMIDLATNTIVESGNFATASVWLKRTKSDLSRGLGCNSDRQRF
jgi:hypothetical protein